MVICFFSEGLFAQQGPIHLTVQSRTRERFHLFFNGIQQNIAWCNHIALSNIPAGTFWVYVEMEGGKKGGLEILFGNEAPDYVLEEFFSIEEHNGQVELLFKGRNGKDHDGNNLAIPEAVCYMPLATSEQTRSNMELRAYASPALPQGSSSSSVNTHTNADPLVISNGDLEVILIKIETKTFDDQKLKEAKKQLKNRRFYADQLRQIAQLFDFDDARKNFLIAAYPYCYDPAHFSVVYETFTFDRDVKELRAKLGI